MRGREPLQNNGANMQYKVGQLVRYVEDGDVGIITSIEENGNYWVEFASGQTADCLCSELEEV